ncbi:MAG TPA: Hcp family type VI secretion system effector [Thermoleophilaceae bacterium]|nr:Hcp family type VI secretion system effector [Thermoleophilaceae bacterium]
MAIDYFLKIDGIPGESLDAKHKGEIEVQAWSWGETNALHHGGPGGGGGAGKVQMQDFSFTTRISKASPNLLLACASGKHLKSALLTARKAGKPQAEFLTFSLSDVLVSAYQTGGAEGEVMPMDSVSLNFSKIQVEYKQQNPDGSLGASVKAGWDVKQNKKF